MSMALDGVPRSRSTDPITSVDAGRAADLVGSRDAVLMVMRSHPGDWSQQELEERLRFRWSPSRVRTAVSELVGAGLVEPVPDSYRRTRYGRRARVYRLI